MLTLSERFVEMFVCESDLFVLFSVPLSVGPVLTLSEVFVIESDLLRQCSCCLVCLSLLDLC